MITEDREKPTYLHQKLYTEVLQYKFEDSLNVSPMGTVFEDYSESNRVGGSVTFEQFFGVTSEPEDDISPGIPDTYYRTSRESYVPSMCIEPQIEKRDCSRERYHTQV